MRQTGILSKLAQASLVAACLTLATASAQIVNESTDFSNSAGTPTLLPVGTLTVNGLICTTCSDPMDWFAVPGLTVGDTIGIMESNTGVPIEYFVEDTVGNVLHSGTINGITGDTFTVAAPAGGELVFGQQFANQTTGSSTYSVNIHDVGMTTPEPGTVVTVAFGIAALAALRRRRHNS